MPNPVRIYVLHHPESDAARKLSEEIYRWFRLPSLDGIPVYVRSEPASGSWRGEELPADWHVNSRWPLPPYGLLRRQAVLEYLVPLVDARMVRDPIWHDYLSRLASYCEEGGEEASDRAQGVLLPVALHPTAFNLPRDIARRNFIRHELDPHGADSDQAGARQAATEETLKHLTEAMARDLDGRAGPRQKVPSERFKIFISYARADGTQIAKALRDYIQGETQCLAFLDENDIGYGQPFDAILEQQVGGVGSPADGMVTNPKADADRLARAMIVVHTDHYADRSWCRWEIDRFTSARAIPCASRTESRETARIHVFDPVLVVDAVSGPRVTRVLPELAQVPLIRWSANRARLCFSLLMREVVLGLRDVRVAQQAIAEDPDVSGSVYVNRLPRPAAIQRVLSQAAVPGGKRPIIRYPGYGLSLIELRLLQRSFKEVGFRAYRDLLQQGTAATGAKADPLSLMRGLLDEMETGGLPEPPLCDKVFAISTSYSDKELAARGILPQHQDEALIHLLRPLLRLGVDLSYGGLPPLESEADRPSATRNITAALLRLVSEERPEEAATSGTDGRQTKIFARRGPLLFNVCAWPRHESVTPEDEAAWINSYRILRILPEYAKLPPFNGPIPKPNETRPPGYLRYVAVITSAIRAGFEKGFDFQLPAKGPRTICPAAFIFMGGRLEGFSGIMPGIMEEFLYAADTVRPIYLFGGLGGASGVIARALCDAPAAVRPPELTMEHYRDKISERKLDDYRALLEELRPGDPNPAREFDRLWALIRKHRKQGLRSLFNNGLEDQDNEILLTTDDTGRAVQLAWKGICAKFLGETTGAESPQPSAKHAPKSSRRSRSTRR